MITLRLVLQVLGLVALFAAAVGVQSRFNLTAAGLFLWLLSLVVVA